MIQIINDTPSLFKGQKYIVTDDHKRLLNVIADALVNKRLQVINLLTRHNIAVSQNSTNEEILNMLWNGFNKNKSFTKEFAELVTIQKRVSSVTDDEDNSKLTDTEKKDRQIAIGGWLTAINGIVGGLGGLVGMFNRPDGLTMVNTTNAQILALAKEKEAARRRNNIVAIVFVFLLLITAGVVIYKTAKK